MIIENKDKFTGEIRFILDNLEKAIQNGDYFSTSVLITRLERKGIKLAEISCDSQESVVQ